MGSKRDTSIEPQPGGSRGVTKRRTMAQRPFAPTRNQLAALRVAVANPGFGYRQIAREIRMDPSTVKGWRRNPRFNAWWSDEMMAAARDFAGPALNHLVGVIQDPQASQRVKVEAIRTFFQHVSPNVTHEQGAILALTSAFGPGDELAVASRDGATGDEIRAIVRRRSQSHEEMQRGHAVGAIELPNRVASTEAAATVALSRVQDAEQRQRELDEVIDATPQSPQDPAQRAAGVPDVVPDIPKVLENLAELEHDDEPGDGEAMVPADGKYKPEPDCIHGNRVMDYCKGCYLRRLEAAGVQP